jgi:hypothetical protein
MSLNTLKIATDGYLKRTTKTTLVIGVSGYLNYGSSVVLPETGFGGGANRRETESYERNKKRLRNEKLLIEILKFWSKELR